MEASPADMPSRRPLAGTSVTEEHALDLRKFAYFPVRGSQDSSDTRDPAVMAWENSLESLADLAEPEEWTGSTWTSRARPILDSYLRYTYQRLVMEEKISLTEDGEHAAFNTGLLTIHAEEVFAFFDRNPVEDKQRWRFVRWAPESSRDILKYFGDAPQLAEYVTTAAELVYDWRRDLKLAYDHILVDNLDRFPADLAQQPVRARQALDHALDSTLRRVRRNYKLVVPQWYPRLGDAGAQFLMPLDLTGSGSADLALVVSAIGDHAYRGHTVLTLDMAYTNARLVARPDSDWLAPRASAIQTLEDAFASDG